MLPVGLFSDLKEDLTNNPTALEFVSDVETGFHWRRFLILAFDVLGNALTLVLVREIAQIDSAAFVDRVQLSVLVLLSVVSTLASAVVANNQEKRELDALEFMLSHMEDNIEARKTGLHDTISNQKRPITAAAAANRMVRYTPAYRLPITLLHVVNLVQLFPELVYSGALTMLLGLVQLKNAALFNKINTSLEESRLKIIQQSKTFTVDKTTITEHKKKRFQLELLVNFINTITHAGALPLFVQSFFTNPGAIAATAATGFYQIAASLLANRSVQEAYASAVSTHFAIAQGKYGRPLLENIIRRYQSLNYFIQTIEDLMTHLKNNAEFFQRATSSLPPFGSAIQLDNIHTFTPDLTTITAPTSGFISLDNGPIAIAGESGAGKTSLLYTLMCRLKMAGGGFCVRFKDDHVLNPANLESLSHDVESRNEQFVLVDSQLYPFAAQPFITALLSSFPELYTVGNRDQLEDFLKTIIHQFDIFRTEELLLLLQNNLQLNNFSRGQKDRAILLIHIIGALFSQQKHIIIGCDEPLSAVDETRTKQQVTAMLSMLHTQQPLEYLSVPNDSRNPYFSLLSTRADKKHLVLLFTTQDRRSDTAAQTNHPITTIFLENQDIRDTSDSSKLQTNKDNTTIRENEKIILIVRALDKLVKLLKENETPEWDALKPILAQIGDNLLHHVHDSQKRSLITDRVLSIQNKGLEHFSRSLCKQLDELLGEVDTLFGRLTMLHKKMKSGAPLTQIQQQNYESLETKLKSACKKFEDCIDTSFNFAKNFSSTKELTPLRLSVDHYISSVLQWHVIKLLNKIQYSNAPEYTIRELSIGLKILLNAIVGDKTFRTTSQPTIDLGAKTLEEFIAQGPIITLAEVLEIRTKVPGTHIVSLNQQYLEPAEKISELIRDNSTCTLVASPEALVSEVQKAQSDTVLLLDLTSYGNSIDSATIELINASASKNHCLIIFVNAQPPALTFVKKLSASVTSVWVPEEALQAAINPEQFGKHPLQLFPEYNDLLETTHGVGKLVTELNQRAGAKYQKALKATSPYDCSLLINWKIIQQFIALYRPDHSDQAIINKVVNQLSEEINEVATVAPDAYVLFVLNRVYGSQVYPTVFSPLTHVPIDIVLINRYHNEHGRKF